MDLELWVIWSIKGLECIPGLIVNLYWCMDCTMCMVGLKVWVCRKTTSKPYCVFFANFALLSNFINHYRTLFLKYVFLYCEPCFWHLFIYLLVVNPVSNIIYKYIYLFRWTLFFTLYIKVYIFVYGEPCSLHFTEIYL